jgi:polyphosphate kinase
MPRNLFRRIEVVFPIEDGRLCDRVYREILGVSLADNTKARFLGADGVYRRAQPAPGEAPHRSQTEFIALAQPRKAEKTGEARLRVELAPPPSGRSPKRPRRLGA